MSSTSLMQCMYTGSQLIIETYLLKLNIKYTGISCIDSILDSCFCCVICLLIKEPLTSIKDDIGRSSNATNISPGHPKSHLHLYDVP